MAAYDPQKTRNRPTPAADQPAPVDAFLDAMSNASPPAASTDIEFTSGGERIVHTADVAGEKIVSEPSPRPPSSNAGQQRSPLVQSVDSGRSKVAIVVVAVVAALVAVLLISRKRR